MTSVQTVILYYYREFAFNEPEIVIIVSVICACASKRGRSKQCNKVLQIDIDIFSLINLAANVLFYTCLWTKKCPVSRTNKPFSH